MSFEIWQSNNVKWIQDQWVLKCVYTTSTKDGFVILCLYVDDMLIIGNNIGMIKSTKKIPTNNFNMKDMGVADVILGIKISRTSDR